MVICEHCGLAGVPGEFCGGCGNFVPWDARPAPAPPAGGTVPAAGSAVGPAAAGGADRGRRGEGTGGASSGPGPFAGPSTEPPATATPTAAPTTASATAVEVPAAAGPTPAPGVGAVRPDQPAEPVAPPAAPVRPAEEPPEPGDLICGNCGAGNLPARKFCRRCAQSLQDARVVPRPPWWRRLTTRRRRPQPAAGDRPRAVRSWRRPRLLVVLLLVVALPLTACWLLRDQLAAGVETVRDRVATPQQIHAVTLKASSESPDHPARLAADGTTDRYWAPARPGDGRGEYLEAEFAGPFRLLDVVVHPGASANAEQFLAAARPQALLLTMTAPDGRVTTRTLTLADTPGPQRFHVAVGAVLRIRLTVDAAYGTGQDRRVAVAEVEFFKRP
ncbi:NADase-type glycan-binding domain-containing protein [Kitasatospora paracochleata]|uniref:Zinc ribbon domain-containing protein n=1 Tax=Kitasatospora paracochleata TaxID=58354 RepID=A0ABT1IVK0_9ACTN|nr:hypothetical protein [Kitasatospora paracochleata]MCP2309158.1 hypothetical protein [Kitasatospora paracochleata]